MVTSTIGNIRLQITDGRRQCLQHGRIDGGWYFWHQEDNHVPDGGALCDPYLCSIWDICWWDTFGTLRKSLLQHLWSLRKYLEKWDHTNTGQVNPTYAAAYNLCEAWILQPLARITLDAWMEELILVMKLLPEVGFLNMDNLYWEKFDKGGVGIFDLESTNMLRTLTQFADHKRKRHKNGDVSKSPRAGEQHTS